MSGLGRASLAGMIGYVSPSKVPGTVATIRIAYHLLDLADTTLYPDITAAIGIKCNRTSRNSMVDGIRRRDSVRKMQLSPRRM
ncbi:hypothetical protein Tco_1103523 [Tanacetum coccineum]